MSGRHLINQKSAEEKHSSIPDNAKSTRFPTRLFMTKVILSEFLRKIGFENSISKFISYAYALHFVKKFKISKLIARTNLLHETVIF